MNSPLDSQRIVIKIGSSTLTHPATGKLNLARIDTLARVLSDLKNSGKEIILVSSGAVAVGVSKLGLTSRPKEMEKKQAAAAVGQCELMYLYDKFFMSYGNITSQVLLTKDILETDKSKENVINTFSALLEYGTIPIVNENDTIAYDEIEFGDNDTLSAIVAVLAQASTLIILSDIDGLFTKDPHIPGAALIPEVREITPEILALGGGSSSSVGTGGMSTKLAAAQLAGEYNIPTVIVNGENPHVIYDVLEGNCPGTIFYPSMK